MSSQLQHTRFILEELIETEGCLSVLEGSVSASELDLVFRLVLGGLIRTGPSGSPAGRKGPARLLAIAQRAAARGYVLLGTPAVLRKILTDLEADLHRSGTWSRHQPLWWSPLPETSWAECAGDNMNTGRMTPLFPTSPNLARAFSGTSPWWYCEKFLKPELTTTLYQDLETAWRQDGFAMERAGVGADDRITGSRTDTVRYLTGLEKDLIEQLPNLAALVQWCLGHLVKRLGSAFGKTTVTAPRRCLLARYAGPSEGYHCHLDNPGGAENNGRAYTLVVYLNPAGEVCRGGELAVWEPGSDVNGPPEKILPPLGAILFQSRSIPHQVLPLREGPSRWALIFFFNDELPEPLLHLPSIPKLTVTDALQPIKDPPLPEHILLCHELDERRVEGEIRAYPLAEGRPRVGIVSTVYREEDLDNWCADHLAMGLAHLVLVFDHMSEPAEAARAAELRKRYTADQLSIWSGEDLFQRYGEVLDRFSRGKELLRFAGLGGSASAVCARQTLNATLALCAAKSNLLGGKPLDWLLHLDGDERFYLEGRARGGETLFDHFATAYAAGIRLIRYLNHELSAPGQTGRGPVFKLNPRLAAARLGSTGWAHVREALDQARAGFYFNGYHNGKSAVAVSAGSHAAGVHGWYLSQPCTAQNARFLAGPSILHHHLSTPADFGAKYLVRAEKDEDGPRLFPPAPAEEAAFELIRTARREGVTQAVLQERFYALAETLTIFSPSDIALMEDAGLFFRPHPQKMTKDPG